MDGMVSYLAWVSVAVFTFMIIYRLKKFSSMPLHLRWEIYPLPLEPKRHYGGSFMEEIDYVKKPRHHVRINGLLEMASEVFFLKKVKEYNRFGMWPFSFAMHWGIYLLFLWVLLLVVGGIFNLDVISPLANASGMIALIIGAFGSLGLFLKRATNAELASYTAPVDYFNLLFLFGIFSTGVIGWATGASFFEDARSYVSGVLFLQPAPVPSWVLLHFALFELFLIYMPFSRLFHYVAKYFTFDKVFWDDILNLKGSEVDQRVSSQLSYRVTWSGPHIVPDKTWAEEVEITDAREGK